MGRPTFIPKTAPSPSMITASIYYTHAVASTDITHYPKRHLDPISRFATVHFLGTQTDRPTDRPTEGIGNKPVRIPAYALYMYITTWAAKTQ